MKLDDEQKAMQRGALGAPLRWAVEQQIAVGRIFGAPRLRPAASVQLGAEVGTMGAAGVRVVERLAAAGARSRIPAVTAACSVDFARANAFGVTQAQVETEQRLHIALRDMGFLDAATCVNYQTVSPPRFAEHLAWGDTGAVTFANGVVGARSNYEGGPAALAAGLTGLVPEYGFHLDEARAATRVYDVRTPLAGIADWSALGALIGSEIADYWTVPAVLADASTPTVDELKHFAAAAASFGSVAMFHVVGATPEARSLEDACGGSPPPAPRHVARADLDRVFRRYAAARAKLDLVVFSAPQLSLFEADAVIACLAGRRIASGTRMILTVNAAVESELRRLGLAERLEAAGGELLTGTCFYVMAPAVVREHLGARTLLTPSTKLANILGVAGYDVALASVERCVDAAVAGVLP